MLLEVKNLSFAYADRTIFEKLSFTLPQPSRILLCGQNGSGKTTLLKLLAGSLAPMEGFAYCESKASSLRVAFLGHEPPLYPSLTVKENILFWLKLEAAVERSKPVLWEVALEILDKLEVSPFAGRRAGELSRGTAQKINIARLLLSEADILLLDEPETGLDNSSLLSLYSMLLDLPQKTIVWASHLLNFTDNHNGTHFFTHRLHLISESYAELSPPFAG